MRAVSLFPSPRVDHTSPQPPPPHPCRARSTVCTCVLVFLQVQTQKLKLSTSNKSRYRFKVRPFNSTVCCWAAALSMARQTKGDDRDEFKEGADDAHVATSSGTSSRFRGVSWITKRQKWKVQISIGRGKTKYVGIFLDEVAAARAYDAYAIAKGIQTQRNFPNEDEDDVVAEAARVRAAPHKRKKAASTSSSKSSRFGGDDVNDGDADVEAKPAEGDDGAASTSTAAAAAAAAVADAPPPRSEVF